MKDVRRCAEEGQEVAELGVRNMEALVVSAALGVEEGASAAERWW
jgi:hypothetical protein